MLKRWYSTFPIVLFIVFSSCVGTQSLINIEILEPSVITYPPYVQKVGYLNRSPRSLDVFSNIELSKVSDADLYIIDTIICNSIKRGFEDGKEDYSLSYLENILYLSDRHSDTIQMKSSISNNSVKNICSKFGVDAIITFDFYKISFGEYVYISLENEQYEKAFSLYMEMKWTVNVPEKEDPLRVFNYIDTLYFFSKDNLSEVKNISPISLIREGSYEVGYIFGRWNTPAWNEISRVVYIGREEELKSVTKYTDEGDWDSALQIWNEYLASDDKKLAAKSAHNIAVHYEIEDNIKQALEYSKKAYELWPSPRIEFYKEELEIRVLNKQDIIRQLRAD